MRTTLGALAVVALVTCALSISRTADVAKAVGPSLRLGSEVLKLDAALTQPTQVHIALYDESRTAQRGMRNGMTISWATAAPTTTSVVRFGVSATDISSTASSTAPSARYTFCDYNSPWFHHVVIPGDQLQPDTTYFYQCGDPEGGWSEVQGVHDTSSSRK
ncbi:hypothetical protein PINS_up002469 [Pythium insidiosum]|nr:hypothetical protein PINS_up002469 [Pythium insidiosum]